MDNLNVIDRFTETFVTYIDSGFGLLAPDIAFLTTVLIGIDITLAGLFWAFAEDRAILPALIKKVLYVGAFAFILNRFSNLADIIFQSFAGLGLHATATSIGVADLMRPGFIAATGYSAGVPILQAASDLMGPIAFFENFVTIAILLFAWVIVLLAFFILSIQLFVTILEFKLTTLAGFVLVPFGLWNKSAFLAERVLGSVVTAGIKLMVLAVIVGIGSTVFGEFTSSFAGSEITLEEAASTVLGALSIFMLGIFGPGIAAGLVSGAPQLGAGAVAGTAAGLALGGAAAGGAVVGAGRALGAAGGGATRAAASLAGGATASYQMARATSDATGAAGVASGVAGVARAGAGATGQGARNIASRATSGIKQAFADGERGAFAATGGTHSATADPPTPPTQSDMAPDWARSLRRHQRLHEGVTVAAHTLSQGDRPGVGETPKLKDED